MRWKNSESTCEARCQEFGALIIQMISTGIVILGIDQNYSQIIIGAVLLDRLNNWLVKRRLSRVA